MTNSRKRSPLVSEKAESAWKDAYDYRPAPQVVSVPWIAYIYAAAVGIVQFIGLMLVWPNP